MLDVTALKHKLLIAGIFKAVGIKAGMEITVKVDAESMIKAVDAIRDAVKETINLDITVIQAVSILSAVISQFTPQNKKEEGE